MEVLDVEKSKREINRLNPLETFSGGLILVALR